MLHELLEEEPSAAHALVSTHDRLRPALEREFPPAGLGPCPSCGEPTLDPARPCKACELQRRAALAGRPPSD
jgi:hypothetical protein